LTNSAYPNSIKLPKQYAAFLFNSKSAIVVILSSLGKSYGDVLEIVFGSALNISAKHPIVYRISLFSLSSLQYLNRLGSID